MNEEWQLFRNTLREIYVQLGSFCNVTMLNEKMYSGYLYTVDPETRTVLILQQQRYHQERSQERQPSIPSNERSVLGSVWTMVAVRMHAMKDLEFQDNKGLGRLTLEEMDSIAHISRKLYDPADIQSRKNRLVAMLRTKCIPVESTADDKVIHIMNSVHVHPPYVSESIECANDVIRERVKGMILRLQET
ncbi:hypothetical protein BX616_001870 [Lobosporangium transversale]|uniref:AD domain-containing protein n=1 Tax=Lobosporangium transversale TaxID=64571 RepID=A0A1Y2GTD2_9FUNG|nr:hypothetical protein BCR41DRAFT_420536 [Lobosporangium transversale]KAF9902624.1 hypothetical protein BX616_001870 [Lobosporangium transversale]ORZ22769.1 hypothetical protein BCR41DRAFT_420536 [Lobosporangium transversale]|eukprot:XP_021883323.1 hypothetical protein BCR41DRAFT_420536 [Lobosporangium transversale]